MGCLIYTWGKNQGNKQSEKFQIYSNYFSCTKKNSTFVFLHNCVIGAILQADPMLSIGWGEKGKRREKSNL